MATHIRSADWNSAPTHHVEAAGTRFAYRRLGPDAGVPVTAASATFALKAGVWFRRARLLIVSPDSRVNLARRQAETPLIALFRFAGPAQTSLASWATAGRRL
jgi:hypothetical protein